MITLTSGRKIKIIDDALGIDSEGNIYDGSDMCWTYDRAFTPPLTNAEKREIAAIMITRWEQYMLQIGVEEEIS